MRGLPALVARRLAPTLGGSVTTEESGMGIGVGILLLAVGAILAFAVHASVSGLDVQVVGVVLDLVVFAPRRRTAVYGTVAPVRSTIVTERDVY